MINFYASTEEYAERTIGEKLELATFERSHFYQQVGNVSKISIDGITVKKNNWYDSYMGILIGYDTLIKYVAMAEADPQTDTILFVIDSNGGDVDGLFEFVDIVSKCKKKTVSLYKNTGASASILYGTVSNEVYATPYSELGSIGVVAVYREGTSGGQYKVAVSKNAKNKNCTIENKCGDRIQQRIDHLEDMMLERVSSHTGVSREDLIEKFGMGAMVNASVAKEAGLISNIVSEGELMVQLTSEKNMENNMEEKILVLKQASVAVAKFGLNPQQAEDLSSAETFQAFTEKLMALHASPSPFNPSPSSPQFQAQRETKIGDKAYTMEDFEAQLKAEVNK